jgi:hypothetical protein
MRFGERAALAKPYHFPWRGEGKRARAALEELEMTDKDVFA